MDMYDVRELVLVTSDEFVRLYGEVASAIEQYAAASKVCQSRHTLVSDKLSLRCTYMYMIVQSGSVMQLSTQRQDTRTNLCRDLIVLRSCHHFHFCPYIFASNYKVVVLFEASISIFASLTFFSVSRG